MMCRSIAFLFIANGFGGYEKRMLTFIEWLISYKHLNIIIFTNDFVVDHYKNRFNFLKNNNPRIVVKKFNISSTSFLKKINGFIKINFILFKYFFKFDILCSGSSGARVTSFFSIFKKNIVNIVQTEYFNDNNSKAFKYINKILYKQLFKNAYKICFLNPSMYKKTLKRYPFVKNKNTSIVPCSFIKHSQKKLQDMNKKKLIMWMGNFAEHKQPLILLKAVNKIKSLLRDKEYKVEFYGRGVLQTKMEEYIKKNKLTDIVKVDFTNNTHKTLEKAKIFVSSQKYTNYPSQVLLEAMDSYCIPIATNVPDTELLITKDNGFLFNDNDELAKVLTKIIYRSENELKMLRKKNKKISLKQNIDRYGQYFIELLNYSN
ncbi:MAG: glycosyltransferase family 4 protein [Firmicutes bacterium]|nr:glycosyltransferase family 4 protein [Bacillota bacterium]